MAQVDRIDGAERFGVPGFYEVLYTESGPHHPAVEHRGVVRAAWTPDWSVRRDSEVQRRVEEGQPLLVNGDGSLPALYRLDGWKVDPKGGLVLQTSLTDYAELLVTNNADWRAVPEGVRSNALAVAAVVVSSDLYLLLGRRPSRLRDGMAQWHVLPSGHPHPPQSMLEGVLSELESELGCTSDCVRTWAMTGMIRSLENGKPEVVYLLRLHSTAAELMEAQRSAPERWEFEEVIAIPWEASAVSEWLERKPNETVPAGHAALLLAGRSEFGDAWALEVTRAISTTGAG